MTSKMFPNLAARETFVAEINFAAQKQKMFLPGVKNSFASRTQILRPKHIFPSLATPANITRNIVSATMFPSLARPLASMTGTATITPQIKNLIGRASENKRAARAARNYEQVLAILCKTTTSNYLIYSFDDNLSIKPQISNSLYLI